MSAVAAVASKQGIVLLSDGISFYTNDSALPENGTLYRKDCRIRSTDTSKIIKINNQVGVQWIGNMLPDLQDRFRKGCTAKGLQEPGEIADYLSTLLKQEYRRQGIDISKVEGTYNNVSISISGFDAFGTPWGMGITAKNGFKPAKYMIAQNGMQTNCMVPFVDEHAQKEFDRLLEKHNRRTTDPEELATAAFTEMIRNYEDQDMIVGGKIFCELLQPRRQSKFRQAMLN